MHKVWSVAWREFKYTVLRPIFVLAILGLPILMIGFGAVAVLVMAGHEEPPLVGTMIIVESSGDVAVAASIEFDEDKIRQDQVREQREAAERAIEGLGSPTSGLSAGQISAPMQRGEIDIDVESVKTSTEDGLDQVKERVRSGDLLALAIVPESVIDVATSADASSGDEATTASAEEFQLIVAEDLDSDHVRLIERRLGQAVVRVRAERAGHEPEEVMALLERPDARTTRLLAGGGEADASKGFQAIQQMIPMVFMMLIWIGTFSSAQHLMMSTIEEKSNRVMEVLLSAVSPMQLMTGKILGYGAVGLLIVSIYSSLGIAALVALASFSEFLHWMDIVYLGVFYIMAYAMIASLLAAVGSAVSDIREANTLVTPVMMILMAPLMLWFPIIQDPNGTVAVVFSFVPPAIPFAMILRLAAEEPIASWQIVASIVWGFICVVGMVWAAAKIFRVGVLMTGKPPSPLELLKWVRYK